MSHNALGTSPLEILSRKDIEILYDTSKGNINFIKVLAEFKQWVNRNECAKLFSHLCVDDQKYTQGLFLKLFLYIDENDYDWIKFVEWTIEEILKIKDNFREARINKVLDFSL